jgi:flagellar basal-body rod protein FlgC
MAPLPSNLPSIARSGMAAADQRLQAHAHNLANAGTEGFRRSAVQAQAVEGGGVQTRWTRSADIGPALAEDLVGQRMASHAFAANLAVFKTWDQMTGSLLDAVA